MNRSQNIAWTISNLPIVVLSLVNYVVLVEDFVSIPPQLEIVIGFGYFFFFMFTLVIGFVKGRYVEGSWMSMSLSDYKLSVVFFVLFGVLLVLPIAISISFDSFGSIIGKSSYMVYYLVSILFGISIVYLKDYILMKLASNKREKFAPISIKTRGTSHLLDTYKVSGESVILFFLGLVGIIVLVLPFVMTS